jgi:lysozyme
VLSWFRINDHIWNQGESMTESLLNRIKAQLVRHEGLRLKPYRCTAGKLTIGICRNLDDRGISQKEAYAMLESDIQDCEQWLIDEIPLYDAHKGLLPGVALIEGFRLSSTPSLCCIAPGAIAARGIFQVWCGKLLLAIKAAGLF